MAIPGLLLVCERNFSNLASLESHLHRTNHLDLCYLMQPRQKAFFAVTVQFQLEVLLPTSP
jgi:hypothetical protein